MDPWFRGREVARGGLRSSPKPEKNYFVPSERNRVFLSSVFDTPVHKCVCIRRLAGTPPCITGRVVNTVNRGWVEAPNERSPFRFMTQSLVLSIDIYRGLGISTHELSMWLSLSQADLGPTSAQDFFFSIFFFQVWNFLCEKLCS